jgi:hypothetical protein
MRKAAGIKYFKGFLVENPKVVLSHPYYVDDSLLIGETSIDNLWAM